MTEFLGLEHHWRKRTLANPHSMLGMLTVCISDDETLLSTAQFVELVFYVAKLGQR